MRDVGNICIHRHLSIVYMLGWLIWFAFSVVSFASDYEKQFNFPRETRRLISDALVVCVSLMVVATKRFVVAKNSMCVGVRVLGAAPWCFGSIYSTVCMRRCLCLHIIIQLTKLIWIIYAAHAAAAVAAAPAPSGWCIFGGVCDVL